ncbi:PEP-utilizing enzyme [Candidatus Levibacter sp. Uisw_134_01]|uniref:PEP-utilizing enzyme n=1 Tax=Candidatus Levibacter sp. Uisw_134_01 TaxID=3230999 RepID=UPI003D49BD7D
MSLALELINQWGRDVGLDRSKISSLKLEDLRSIQNGQTLTSDLYVWINEIVTRGEILRDIVHAIELPPLICKESDFFIHKYPEMRTNFFGSTNLTAPCVELTNMISDDNLSGKIILISRADPGFDWIFSRKIAGIVTMHGGINSHMAIRASEFGLPAAIGVGELLFNQLINCREIELNPVVRTIRGIS